LAGASTTAKTLKECVEQCWTLLGWRRGRIWFGRRVRRTRGERASVGFDGAWVLEREETHGDIIGFLHTHPDGPAAPSLRDVRTMRAWCGCFSKPLLCLIDSPDGVCGYRFDGDQLNGRKLGLVELFPRGVVIGVECDGE
jgi:proteasome lid subunit RPN8/RPN11